MDPWQYEHGVCTIGNNVLNLTITSSSNNLSKVWTAEGHVIIHRNIKGKLTVKYILVNLQSFCCPNSIGTKWHWTLQRWRDHIPYDHSSFRLGKWLWELRERNIQASSPSFYRSLLHCKNKLVVLTTEWLPWLQPWVGYERFLLVLETNWTRQP